MEYKEIKKSFNKLINKLNNTPCPLDWKKIAILLLVVFCVVSFFVITLLRSQVSFYNNMYNQCTQRYNNLMNSFVEEPINTNKETPPNQNEIECTSITNNQLDIQPKEGCETTRITLKDFEIDNTKVDILAIFTKDEYFTYIFSLFFDGKAVETKYPPFFDEGSETVFPQSGGFKFVKVKEKEMTKFVGIVIEDEAPDFGRKNIT